MLKKTNAIWAVIATTATVAICGLAFSHNSIIDVLASRNIYTLTLDSNNQIQSDNSVLTSSGNKVFFDKVGDVTYNPSNAWATLVDSDDHAPMIYNTNEIKGMTSISINADYAYLKLLYGGKVNGNAAYSNFVEFNSSTVTYNFPQGSEPSFIKIVGETSGRSNIINSVTIQYSCSENEYVATNADLFEYTLINNNTEYRLDGYKEDPDFHYIYPGDNISDLVIPASINGLPVIEIGEKAFKSKANLRTITIPSSVNTIGSLAFAYNTDVTYVNVPSTVTNIADDAFFMCGGYPSNN